MRGYFRQWVKNQGLHSVFMFAGLCCLGTSAGPAAAAEVGWQAVVVETQAGPSVNAAVAQGTVPSVKRETLPPLSSGDGRSKGGRKPAGVPALLVPGRGLTAGIETGTIDANRSLPSVSPPLALAANVPVPDAVSTTGRFCINIKPQVEEMRIAFQKKSLAEVEAELEKRVKLLEGKIAEYKIWLDRRKDFSDKAQDALVKIYTKMRPDAAAQQLASVDSETAAAVLLKLDARAASAILNDMDPKLAAMLAAVVASAARTNDEGSKSATVAP